MDQNGSQTHTNAQRWLTKTTKTHKKYTQRQPVLREERDGEKKGNTTRTRKKTAADVRESERESEGSVGNEAVKSWAIQFLID